jgi:hypothetical protein
MAPRPRASGRHGSRPTRADYFWFEDVPVDAGPCEATSPWLGPCLGRRGAHNRLRGMVQLIPGMVCLFIVSPTTGSTTRNSKVTRSAGEIRMAAKAGSSRTRRASIHRPSSNAKRRCGRAHASARGPGLAVAPASALIVSSRWKSRSANASTFISHRTSSYRLGWSRARRSTALASVTARSSGRARKSGDIGHGARIGAGAIIGLAARIGAGAVIGPRADVPQDQRVAENAQFDRGDWLLSVASLGRARRLVTAVWSARHGLRFWIDQPESGPLDADDVRLIFMDVDPENGEPEADHLLAFISDHPALARHRAQKDDLAG